MADAGVVLDRACLGPAAAATGVPAHELEAMLHAGGFPAERRPAFWAALASADLPEPLHEPQEGGEQEQEAVARKIDRDVDRTLPQHPLFRQTGGPGQQQLRRLLLRHARLDPGLGYCQGMNFVCAHVMAVVAGELGEDGAFAVFAGVMRRTRGLFLSGVPGYLAVMEALERCVGQMMPRLEEKLRSLDLGVSFICSGWIHALFVCDGVPEPLTSAVWDAFLVFGLPALGRAWMAMMVLSQQQAVQLPLEELLPFFRSAAVLDVAPERLLCCALTMGTPDPEEAFPPSLLT